MHTLPALSPHRMEPQSISGMGSIAIDERPICPTTTQSELVKHSCCDGFSSYIFQRLAGHPCRAAAGAACPSLAPDRGPATLPGRDRRAARPSRTPPQGPAAIQTPKPGVKSCGASLMRSGVDIAHDMVRNAKVSIPCPLTAAYVAERPLQQFELPDEAPSVVAETYVKPPMPDPL